MTIAENLARVRERIAAAARRAGRPPEAVSLMAVSKTFSPERIREACKAGQRLFGENRVQEFAAKREGLAGLDAEFHLIGHLQSNKASHVADIFDAVDSLDSVHLARKLNAAAEKAGKRMPVLIELNVGGEASKTGLAPDDAELTELMECAPQWPHLEIRGLMTIPPFTEDAEAARPFFRVLRQYAARFAARNLPGVSMGVLSMGMSHDFEVAIEEGSTCVRLGTAIFGERPRD
jgi:pyridoxal phosphate enzyme (YggS family)